MLSKRKVRCHTAAASEPKDDPMVLTDEVQKAVRQVIRERFPDGIVEDVDIETGQDDTGEDTILIRIRIAKGATPGDFSGRFFGLTGRVRSVLGDELSGVFPIIRPIEAHA